MLEEGHLKSNYPTRLPVRNLVAYMGGREYYVNSCKKIHRGISNMQKPHLRQEIPKLRPGKQT